MLVFLKIPKNETLLGRPCHATPSLTVAVTVLRQPSQHAEVFNTPQRSMCVAVWLSPPDPPHLLMEHFLNLSYHTGKLHPVTS
ncbi:hypothetical protein E2C01_003890 [Portunus trituberculatus]|uniref:Uncharacterized protein n=1 Tax=Portunus trituberculatus TaxID=210409 RepID=A0A5B7CPZ2_PORTR|nr:hypothetical protein [Portunus trituberculatus]